MSASLVGSEMCIRDRPRMNNTTQLRALCSTRKPSPEMPPLRCCLSRQYRWALVRHHCRDNHD
eukprot:11911930-Alexandrium_andersonii.AAC.2